MIELMIVVGIIGVLASVAVPAMMQYIRNAKKSEATMNLRKLYDASAAYFMTEHAESTGTIVAAQFPAPVGPSPSFSCCIVRGGKCQPSPFYWEEESWKALNFSVDDPFRYQYEYRSSGLANGATFNVIARSDIGCNDQISVFERVGSVDSDFNVTGGAAIYETTERTPPSAPTEPPPSFL